MVFLCTTAPPHSLVEGRCQMFLSKKYHVPDCHRNSRSWSWRKIYIQSIISFNNKSYLTPSVGFDNVNFISQSVSLRVELLPEICHFSWQHPSSRVKCILPLQSIKASESYMYRKSVPMSLQGKVWAFCLSFDPCDFFVQYLAFQENGLLFATAVSFSFFRGY